MGRSDLIEVTTWAGLTVYLFRLVKIFILSLFDLYKCICLKRMIIKYTITESSLGLTVMIKGKFVYCYRDPW